MESWFHVPAQGGFVMTQAVASPETRAPAHPLIESNRVEGTRVYDRQGKHIGTIDHLVIEKVSGRVVYAVVSFSWFFGVGKQLHTIPWEKLHYDTGLGGYHTDITEAELQDAPVLPHDSDDERRRETELRRYWNVPRYWV
jgi:sporulation protein YlmC with PRC-barrel domain